MTVTFFEGPAEYHAPIIVFGDDGKLLTVASRLLLLPVWADICRKYPEWKNRPTPSLKKRLNELEADAYAELSDLTPGLPDDWTVRVLVCSTRGQTESVLLPDGLLLHPFDGLTFATPPDAEVQLDGFGWLIRYDEEGFVEIK